MHTFCSRLIQTAEQHTANTAMTLLGAGGPENTSFGSMLSQIRSLAYRLSVAGIAPGDRVAIIGENHPNWAIAYLGTLYCGAIVVPLDPAATTETLANFLENSECRLTFVSPNFFDKYQQVCEHMGSRLRAVSLQPVAQMKGFDSFTDWAQTARPPDFDSTKPVASGDDIALLIYTSGTTGIPKAVPLTHGNILAQVEGVQEVLNLSHREVILSLLPLFHAYSQIVNLWLATVIGARVVYLNEVTSDEIANGLKEGEVTILTGVPRLWYLFHKKILDSVRAKPRPVRFAFKTMLAANGWLRDSLGFNAGKLFFGSVHRAFGGQLRLAISAGSSFDPEVAQDYHRLGFTILQGYGLTETAGAATVTRIEDNKVGSVGKPLNQVGVKIDEPNNEGIGEVLIRGPIVMSGYYLNHEANQDAFTADGWFRSGDLGRFDVQGHLYIVGRKKDVIVLPSGKNVYPEDVEAHYSKSPLVGELCVLGIRNGNESFALSEKLCAVVVPDFDYLKLNRIANAREAIRFDLDNLGRELPEYQRVRDYVVRAEALPRTATRKIRRFELQGQIAVAASGLRGRDEGRFVITASDRLLLDSEAGVELCAAIARHSAESMIHPAMNLELDLGLDSLARAECIAGLEQFLGGKFDESAAAEALTVADVLALSNGERKAFQTGSVARKEWSELLRSEHINEEERQSVARHKPFTAGCAFLLLKLTQLFARVCLRLEVTGLENLKRLEAPFIVCPNHQSYLDPILVCGVYPYRLLRNIFHVGASEYWSNTFTKQIAKLLRIVPVDPDTNLMSALRVGAAGLRAGKILNIYPEGERSFDGELHPFKKGAAILSTELQLPILPVTLDGVHKVWARKSRRLRLAKVRIHFGEPLYPPAGPASEFKVQQQTARLKAEIERTLIKMRALR